MTNIVGCPFYLFPQLLTDSAGLQVWNNSDTPFGLSSITGDAITFNLRFPGQYHDQETGLSYNYFRDYDPETGRYVQSDPIGLTGGSNTYGYVGGNPISRIDPTGELWFLALAGGGTAAGSGTAAAGSLGFWGTGALIGGVAAVSISGDKHIDSLSRQAEYERAKNFCDTPPPPGNNDCSTLSKQIDHAEQCISLYEAWDAKWLPGRHREKIQTWRKRLQNLKDKHNRECTNKCP